MTKKKWSAGLCSVLTTLCLGISSFALPASAVTVTQPVGGEAITVCDLTITLLGDYTVAQGNEDVCYPSVVHPDDLWNFSLEAKSGTVYTDHSAITSTSPREITFTDIAVSDINSLTLKFETNSVALSVPPSFDVEWYGQDLSGNYTAGSSAIDPNRIIQGYDADTKAAIAGASSFDELNSLTYGYTNEFSATTAVTLLPSGISSVMLAYNPEGEDWSLGEGTYTADKETYGLSDIIAYAVFVGDTQVPSMFMGSGIFYFQLPSDVAKAGYSDEIRILCSGFYAGTDAIYTAEFSLGNYMGSPISADNYVRVLNIDAEPIFSDDDTIGELEEDFSDPDDSAEVEEVDTSRGGIRYSITSNLDKYDLSLISDLNTYYTLTGAPTDAVKLMYADESQIPSSMSYGGFDLATSKSALIQLDKGTYKPEFSTLLAVSGATDVSVKDTAIKEATLSVKPAYTLEIKGTGDLDYTIDDVAYKTASGYLFALDVDVPHYILDNTSGKMYEVMATSDKPNLSVTLGSDVGMIDSIAQPDSPNGFEDVPNTADGITILFLIPIGILIPAVCLGIIFFVRNKRANGGK